jgi:hypothetical protein
VAKDSVIKRDDDIEVSESKAAEVKGGRRYDPIGDGTGEPLRKPSAHTRKTHKAKKSLKAQGGLPHL